MIAGFKDKEILCSWNGQTYQLFNGVNGIGLGTTNRAAHYDDFNSCKQHALLQKNQSQFACAWNGAHFAPYAKQTNTPASASQHGWESMEECVKDLPNKIPLVCGWSGGSYLYNLNGEAISPLLSSDSDKSTENCVALLKIISSRKSTVAKPQSTPPLTDLTQTPAPLKNGLPNSKVGLPWQQCELPQLGYHILKNDGRYITPECAPDTLFSWGNYIKLKWFIDNMGTSPKWVKQLPRPLFATLSPAASFGYGIVPIRLKIKKSVRFRFVPDLPTERCDLFKPYMNSSDEFDNTIFVRYYKIKSGENLSIVDYIICSSEVVESWSYYTAKNYDEILRDYKWNTGPDYRLYNTYYKAGGRGEFLDINLDKDTNFSSTSFNEKMNFYKIAINLGIGDIFVNPSSESSANDHFKTKTPSYYNWNN